MSVIPWPRNPLLVLAVLLALLAGCDGDTPPSEQDRQAQHSAPVPVGVIEAALEPVRLGERFVGRVESRQTVEVRARISGFIQERRFEEGQMVEAGAPLFRIEKDTYQAQVARLRADLSAARAAARNAQARLKRAEALARQGNIAQEELEQRRAESLTADAAIEQAQAALQQAEIDLGYTDITARIAGRIGRAAFDVGDLVGPESGPLARIVTLDPMYVVFPVSQAELVAAEQEAAAAGQTAGAFQVRVQLADGSEYPHPGEVNFVGISVERGTDTVPVRAVLPNPDGRLRDGQFVQVRVEQKEAQQAIIIPQAAIQADQQGRYVLTVTSENRVAVTRIEVGEPLAGGRTTVRSGLSPGDRIVIQGIQRLQPQMAVDPRPVEPPGTGG